MRPFMINLIVDDFPGALRQVTQGGASLVGDPQESEYGTFGWFIGPEGNKVELWQPKQLEKPGYKLRRKRMRVKGSTLTTGNGSH